MATTNTMPYDVEADLNKRDLASRSSLSLSPDGIWIAIVVHGLISGEDTISEQDDEAEPLAAVSEEVAGSEVVIVNTTTGEVQRPFQTFTCSCWPAWSPDRTQLALLTQSGVRRFPRLTLWRLDEDTPRVFESARVAPKLHFQALRWTSDSRRIVCATVSAATQEKPLVTRLNTGELEDLPHVRESLGVLDVEIGEFSAFNSISMRTLGWQLSPDERQVAFLRSVSLPHQPKNTQTNWRQLVVMDLADGAEQCIGEPQGDNWGCSFRWAPDGSALAWVAHAHHCPTKLLVATTGAVSSLHTVELPQDTSFGYMPLGSYPPPAPIWSRDSKTFYVPGKAKLWRFTREGGTHEAIELPEDVGFDWFTNSITALDFPRLQPIEEDGIVWLSRPREMWKVDLSTRVVTRFWKKEPDKPLSIYWVSRAFDMTRGTLYTVHVTPVGTMELHRTMLASGESCVVSTLFLGVEGVEGVEEGAFGPIRSLSWTLPDGTQCGGSLLLPVGWQEGDRPPVVMNVYGDDRGLGQLKMNAFRDASNMLIVDGHFLSAHGYAVFIPDMPQTEAQPAASLSVAGEAAVGALRASGLVDAERIAVMGSSYGGYTTLCLLTGSKLFKAGIVANGVYDLLRGATTNFSQGWTELGQGRMKVSVWEDPTRYLDNSPLYALDKLQAPVLILQGTADKTTGAEAAALFASLQRLEKTGEMLTYHDGGHAVRTWSMAAQRDLHQRLLMFLSRHLM